MRQYFFDFLIDERPILAPDEDMAISYEDLDSEESGRDEGGYMHRIVLREGVKKFALSYSSLRRDEYLYMESLFRGKATFSVMHRDDNGAVHEFMAYRSKHSITIRNAKTGLYKNYSFNIIEC